MRNETSAATEVAEILRQVGALRADPVLSMEEKIEIAKRLVAIAEEDATQKEVQ